MDGIWRIYNKQGKVVAGMGALKNGSSVAIWKNPGNEVFQNNLLNLAQAMALIDNRKGYLKLTKIKII